MRRAHEGHIPIIDHRYAAREIAELPGTARGRHDDLIDAFCGGRLGTQKQSGQATMKRMAGAARPQRAHCTSQHDNGAVQIRLAPHGPSASSQFE